MSELAILGGPKRATTPFPSWPVWDDGDRRAVMGVLESGKWWMYAYGTDEATETGVGGEQRSQVEQFEEEFARFHRVKHGVAVASGSTALEICMSAIGL